MKVLLLISLLALSISAFAEDEQICPPSAGKSALVVMDMQPGFVNRYDFEKLPGNKKKADQAIREQIKAIEEAKRQQIEIIFVEYKGKEHDYGKTDSRLKAALGNYSRAKTFVKNTDGLFENGNQSRDAVVGYLQRKQIGTLVMTGANGGACVGASIVGALKGNCSVVAYSKAIADFNYREVLYPYQGYYPKSKPWCRDCSFKEVSNLEKAADSMVGGGGGSRAPVYTTPVREEGSR